MRFDMMRLVLHLGQVYEALLNLCAESIGLIFCGRVGVYAQVTHLLQIVAANNLLLTQFQYVHLLFFK